MPDLQEEASPSPAVPVCRQPLFVLLVVLFGALLVLVGWRLWGELAGASEERGEASGAVPVELAAVERGPIELRRTFSGTLESMAMFRVAPKVGGRVERLVVDLADEVENGMVVATLDSAEYEQELAQAEAALEVAEATLAEARSSLEIAERAMRRQTTLRERGVSSDVQFDAAQAEQLSAKAALAVAAAQVHRAESALETARIRLGYTQVRASWSRGDGERLVAQRSVQEGDTVAANTPLMTIVELDPIQAVLFVAERDYARLSPGQAVSLRADAHPGETFIGEVARVAPVFEAASRQARVELAVPNPEGLLKPGMFVRAEAVLARVEDAVVVPTEAVVMRDDRPVVFVVDEAGGAVRMTPVALGIEHAGRTQVVEGLAGGRVVTLGQQLLDDGSAVTVAETTRPADALRGAGAGGL